MRCITLTDSDGRNIGTIEIIGDQKIDKSTAQEAIENHFIGELQGELPEIYEDQYDFEVNIKDLEGDTITESVFVDYGAFYPAKV